MKKYFFLFFPFFFLSNCDNDKQEAQLALDKAISLYENAEYNSAKTAIDELADQYPKQIEVKKKSLFLKRQIDLKEQERNLFFCDSMILLRQTQIDSMKQYFVFEKDTVYDTHGKFIEKQHSQTSLYPGNSLRTGVNELGEIYLISVYSGNGNIKHNQLRVSSTSGEFMETEAIPFDGGANYFFKDDNTGKTHEFVTYQKGKDKGVIQFIYNHSNEKLTAKYQGGKPYSYVIDKPFIKSLIKSVDFSVALSDIQNLIKEKEKAEKRIIYLQSKLE
jgi:hypothetical protein